MEGGKQSTFGTNPHLLSDFEVKVDKIHFWGKKSTFPLFFAYMVTKSGLSRLLALPDKRRAAENFYNFYPNKLGKWGLERK